MVSLRSYIVKVVKLEGRDYVAIPLPPDIGISEGDSVSITILEGGELLVKKSSTMKK